MKEKIKNFFLYGGTDKENYNKIKKDIHETNRKTICGLSMIVAICIFVTFILSFIMDVFASSRVSYAVIIGASIIIFILEKCAKGKPVLINICMYAFVAILLAIGILLGTYIEPNQASVSFCILMFAVPLVYTDRPAKSSALILLSIAVYVVAAYFTQNAEMFEFNMSCVIPYGVLSMLISSLLMRLKVKTLVLEMNNRILSITDQLTGMLNRRNYELKVNVLKTNGLPKHLVVCAFDVNGLKTINDNVGHQAGDELICGASKCIEETFGPYGECYRTGGDEFIAILDKPCPDIDVLNAEFQKNMDAFKGNYVKKLSISLGMISASENADIATLLAEADKAMYECKNDYYVKNGLERRKS